MPPKINTDCESTLKNPKKSPAALPLHHSRSAVQLFNRLLKPLRYKWLIFKWGGSRRCWQLYTFWLQTRAEKKKIKTSFAWERIWNASSFKTMKHWRLEMKHCPQPFLIWGNISQRYLPSKQQCGLYIMYITFMCALSGAFVFISIQSVRLCSAGQTRWSLETLYSLSSFSSIWQREISCISRRRSLFLLCIRFSVSLSLQLALCLSLLLKSVDISVPIKWIIPITLPDNSTLSVCTPI